MCEEKLRDNRASLSLLCQDSKENPCVYNKGEVGKCKHAHGRTPSGVACTSRVALVNRCVLTLKELTKGEVLLRPHLAAPVIFLEEGIDEDGLADFVKEYKAEVVRIKGGSGNMVSVSTWIDEHRTHKFRRYCIVVELPSMLDTMTGMPGVFRAVDGKITEKELNVMAWHLDSFNY